MSRNIEQEIKKAEEAISNYRAEIKLELKKLPPEDIEGLEEIIGTDEFFERLELLKAKYLEKQEELETKLEELSNSE